MIDRCVCIDGSYAQVKYESHEKQKLVTSTSPLLIELARLSPKVDGLLTSRTTAETRQARANVRAVDPEIIPKILDRRRPTKNEDLTP